MSAHLAKGNKHVPLLFLGNATARVTDRQLHKLLVWVAAWHGLQHDSDAAICRELGRVSNQVIQNLQPIDHVDSSYKPFSATPKIQFQVIYLSHASRIDLILQRCRPELQHYIYIYI